MGVSYIPGYEAQLVPALAGIGNLVGNIIKPNQGFQLALRDAFAKNPELVQRFADIEANAPGTLSALGFGRGADVVSRVPESVGNIIQRGLRPGVEEALGKPEIVRTAGERAVTGLTAGQQAQDVYELDAFRKAREFFRANPKVSIQDILTSKVDPQTAFALSRSGAGQFLGFQLQNYINERDLDARKSLATANDVSSLQDAITKSKISQSFSRYQTSNAGSPAAWGMYLFGPEIAKLIGEVRPGELEQVRIGDERATAQERITQQLQASRLLTDLDNKIRTYTGEPAGRQVLLQQLNDVLTLMGKYSGSLLTAEYKEPTRILGVPVPLTGRDLIYKDEQGREFTDPTVAIGRAITQAAGGTGGSRSGQIAPDSVFAGLYLRHNGDKNKINEELKRLGYVEIP